MKKSTIIYLAVTVAVPIVIVAPLGLLLNDTMSMFLLRLLVEILAMNVYYLLFYVCIPFVWRRITSRRGEN